MSGTELSLVVSPEIDTGVVILQVADGKRWRYYRNPGQIVTANQTEDVVTALQQVEKLVNQGKQAAGFITYEAAPAFDKALQTHSPSSLPLLWFGIYDSFEEADDLPEVTESISVPKVGDWIASISEPDYHKVIRKIHNYIANGDTYQVNFTMRLRTDLKSSPWLFFRQFVEAQEPCYAAFLNTGTDFICSASPELFFTLDGDHIESKPMKGTRPRGRDSDEDEQLANELLTSEKDRAENVMIVDMVRNDLGKIATVGTVHVPLLFEIEQFYTVWQMTSTVSAKTDASYVDIFRALFPCASITGAPKVRTMQIIHELEQEPRGIYTGAIGYLEPKRRAQFNVAIRTVHINRESNHAEYGTGGGIVWDSTPEGEYAEARTKAAVLSTRRSTFRLFETILWMNDAEYYLLDAHLNRIEASAKYFGFTHSRAQLERKLLEFVSTIKSPQVIVRVYLDKHGEIEIEQSPYPVETVGQKWRIALANSAVNSSDRFLFHKTTHRSVYEMAKRDFPDYDDVVLWNERNEITEATRANVVVKIDGEWVTPPVNCGLLAGTFRAHLIELQQIHERVITLEDWDSAEQVFLINSVRKWIPVEKAPSIRNQNNP